MHKTRENGKRRKESVYWVEKEEHVHGADTDRQSRAENGNKLRMGDIPQQVGEQREREE